MAFIDYFRKLSVEMDNRTSRRVGSNPSYDNIVMIDMPNFIRRYINHDGIVVKPSVGKGNYADIPWICLLSSNRSISPSAQKGLYIVLLFNKTGTSFYLALSQGITNFNQMPLKPKERQEVIAKTVRYFQDELREELVLNHAFTTNRMYLGEQISNLAKGYIRTTIVSKRYDVEDFDEEDFKKSLSILIREYDVIIDHIGNKSYDDVLDSFNPYERLTDLDEALEEIDYVLKNDFIENRDIKSTPILVQKGALKSKRYHRLTDPKRYTKTDFIKKAKENYQTGLKGEQLALEIERKRLTDMNLDPDQYIKWCSIESDHYGYDFETVDVKNGRLHKIYVEVKTSKDIMDTAFFISRHEVDVAKKKQDFYRIMRIFDLTSITPKYYMADGEVEDNFYLDPATYTARYKYEIQ